MFQESVNTRQGLHHILLIAALVGFVQDLSSGGGAEAWSYSYSISPSRRWLEARQWCQQHFTDMVPLRNQEESDFLNNFLPFNKRYYWIGISKSEGGWVWTETDEKVPEYAQHWAPEEPDDIAAQDCVEIYIKRDNDTVLWNNESCRKKKGTVCYTASCKPDSCSANADCVETVGNYTCKCHPGFLGPRCEEAITCKPLQDLEQGDSECSQPYGSNRFSSSCRFYCDLGYDMVGESTLLCQASGLWNLPVPRCQLKKCSSDFFPVAGNVTCVDAVEPFSFGSQCNFTCQEGYSLTRDDTYTCLSSGQWSNPTPTCEVVQCNRLKTPPHASMQCQDPLGVPSYGSMCFVQCEEGFDLIGGNMTKCSAQGNWSHELPVCQARRCNPINPPHGSLSCSDPNGAFTFGSLCTKTCDEGFLLNGTNSTECTSEGVWSTDIPRCLAKRCPTLSSPSHGSLVCSGPHGEFSFASQCTSTCEEGFVMNGTAETECTSLGMWSSELPHCLAQRCPLLDKAPHHGRMNCSHPYSPFSYGSHCDFECNEGFWLRGTPTTTCNDSGHWSQDRPSCQPLQCEAIPALSGSLSMNCSHPLRNFSFGSQCFFDCEDGFSLNGTEVLFCSSSGIWNDSLPNCIGDMPLGADMLLSSGLGIAYVVGPLVLVVLAVMLIVVYVKFRKRGDNMMSEAPAWGDRENPAFDFDS